MEIYVGLRYCSFCWQKTVKYSHCNYCNKWDYGKCHECGEQNIKSEWCPNCKLQEIIHEFSSWTCGIGEIDQLIHESQLKQSNNYWRWIDYTELDDIQYLSEGGYGIVYKAVWNNMPEEIKKNYLNKSKIIAMKKLKNSQKVTKDFINEIKAYHKNKYSYIIPIYGITRDPITKEYVIVMQYCDKGDWKHIIRQQNKSLSWRDRLHMLFNITKALKDIHENGYVHCDIHPGNVLQNEYTTYLSDLGLCTPVNHETKPNEIHGIIPYMAPEVLRRKPFTPASDVYSLGMFMWELTSRRAPFDYRSHDAFLIIDICKDIRPGIVKGTPEIYANLMKSCWQDDPSKRPTCKEIYDIILRWDIFNKNSEIYKILKKAGGIGSDVGCSPGGSDERLEMLTRHSEAYDISRSLNEHINTATLLSRDIREDDLAIEWPDSCSITINAISEELEINNSNLR